MINHVEINSMHDEIFAMCVEYTNKHHVFWPDKIGSEIHKRKNALLYRFSSVSWHAKHLIRMQELLNEEISNLSKGDREAEVVMKYFHSTSYMFDDVIFNIVSLYDYLAGLIGLILNQNVDQWLKWNQLVKSFNDTDFNFPKTKEKIVSIHKSWFDKLANYRAGIYHTKSQRPSYTRGYELPGRLTIEMLMPDEAMKKIPFFKGEERVPISSGVEIVLENAFRQLHEAIIICFNEKA